MKRETLVLGAVLMALVALLAGCSGGLAPTLPSPDGDVDRGQSTIASDSEGQLLPEGLQAGNFDVTLDGSPTRVRQVIPSRDGGISICFVLDSTGSMLRTIMGVIDSIEEFAAEFAGFRVSWSGIEFGDSTPSDGPNSWDFSFPGGTLRQSQRTLVQPAQGLEALQDWLAPINALGGGDIPENALKALMEAREVMAWPVGFARHFIILTDVGAHQRGDALPDPLDYYARPDNASFCQYMGSEVLDAFRGWGIIHAVSPNLYAAWGSPEAVGNGRRNDGQARPAGVDPDRGWDTRELADGGPPEYRTHGGTGGRWIEMPSGGRVDLTGLGIADLIRQTYTVVYQRPEDMSSAHVVITVHYSEGGNPKTATFDLGTVTF